MDKKQLYQPSTLVHTCERCLEIFDRKDYLDKHKQRKSKCKMIYKCIDCDKTFYDKSALNKHHKSPTHINNQQVAAKDSIVINANTNLRKASNMNIKSHNKITVNVYNNTDISGITAKNFNDIRLNIMTPSIFLCKFLKNIHFNDEFPENHNVYINNIRSKVVKVFESDGWNDRECFFIYEIISNLIKFIDGKIEDLCPDKMNAFGDLVDGIEAAITRKEYENRDLREVYKSISMVLYDRKQLIKTTIKNALGYDLI